MRVSRPALVGALATVVILLACPAVWIAAGWLSGMCDLGPLDALFRPAVLLTFLGVLARYADGAIQRVADHPERPLGPYG
ncbi:hypothetical protein ACE7GA_17865 [Roseomonas sp. CCTCC AB2023176]|uniref:hypothetical protein n=1 Tax=Roseomonas sp. CCTCC AB2023176 TaxID=3342640 RepID=UPI0035DDE8A3